VRSSNPDAGCFDLRSYRQAVPRTQQRLGECTLHPNQPEEVMPEKDHKDEAFELAMSALMANADSLRQRGYTLWADTNDDMIGKLRALYYKDPSA
jgi:hypothetical protein